MDSEFDEYVTKARSKEEIAAERAERQRQAELRRGIVVAGGQVARYSTRLKDYGDELGRGYDDFAGDIQPR